MVTYSLYLYEKRTLDTPGRVKRTFFRLQDVRFAPNGSIYARGAENAPLRQIANRSGYDVLCVRNSGGE